MQSWTCPNINKIEQDQLRQILEGDYPAEGLVSLESLPDDSYRFERTSHTLIGRRAGNSFRLGDRVRVTVFRVDLDRRTLDFRLVETGGRFRRRGGGPPQRPSTNKNTKTKKTREKSSRPPASGQSGGKSGKRGGTKRRAR